MAARGHESAHGAGLAEVRTAATGSGRVNQKLRTRQALLDAASELVAGGATPTLAEVAEHAQVSKTTAYRYFPSADDLIAESFFDRDFPKVDDIPWPTGDEPAGRVLAVEGAVNDVLLSHENAMRMIIRNALDLSMSGTDAPPRTGRRRALIDTALAPLHDRLDAEGLGRLRDALALVIGPEAVIAARDVCGLDAEGTRAITRWAAEALVARALEDAAP